VTAADTPAWRRAFNGVERRVGPQLAAVTNSSDFQIAAQTLRRARRAIARPVDGLASRGLHLVGLPSHADVRDLRRQLGEIQREMLALRRDLLRAERDRQGPQ
jgi:hypothetical protein